MMTSGPFARFFWAAVILHQTVGVIPFGPGVNLEEHELLDIQIRIGHHDLAGGVTDLQPPLPSAGKTRRKFLPPR